MELLIAVTSEELGEVSGGTGAVRLGLPPDFPDMWRYPWLW
jgi:hypothetical protein